MASAINKDIVLVVSLVLSVVSLVLLFGVTWYFQSSLDLLQQQVEYDRELLFKLQEQINNKHSDDIINKHDLIKRQQSQKCDCKGKDGSPGPIGPPGNKGKMGIEGKQGRKGDTGPAGPKGDAGNQGPPGNPGSPGNKGEMGVEGKQGVKGQVGPPGSRGDIGDRGPRGIIGDPGLQGKRGQKGDRGDTGDRGPRGFVGDTGLRGSVGEAGNPGAKGAKGDQGPTGLTGNKGEIGYQGLKGDKGKKGDSGSPGPTGLTGSKGVTGQKGIKGDKEERNGGTVYVRWGHDECPSTAQLVYSGRAGGPHYTHAGGGSNPQCLPMDPNFLTPISGIQFRGYIYGAEYQTHTDSNSHVHGRNDHDIPCAVCHVSYHTAVYMVPAKYTCPTGWTREYYGYLMSSWYGSDRHRTQYICIDSALKPVVGSSANQNGLVLYFVEGRCGSLPCPPYDNNRELSCAVCTK